MERHVDALHPAEGVRSSSLTVGDLDRIAMAWAEELTRGSVEATSEAITLKEDALNAAAISVYIEVAHACQMGGWTDRAELERNQFVVCHECVEKQVVDRHRVVGDAKLCKGDPGASWEDRRCRR